MYVSNTFFCQHVYCTFSLLPYLKSSSHNQKGLKQLEGFPGGSEVKASAFNAGDLGSISGWGRSLVGNGNTHSSTLAWRILWTEKPGRLQSTGSQRLGHDFHFHFHFHFQSSQMALQMGWNTCNSWLNIGNDCA